MALVVNKDRHGVLALLGVGAVKFNHQIADFFAVVFLVDAELVVIAFTETAEFFHFVVVLRDQRAEFAAGHLKTVLLRRPDRFARR